MSRHFVILDRDGTLIQERHYLSEPEQVELIPGVAEGLRQLRQMGLGLVVVTNQSGIGRGFFDQGALERIHRRMNELLASEGAWLDKIYFCPHRPEEGCSCRKPAPGLVERAARELGFEPCAGFAIGDKACDVELGQRVGMTTFLVRTGYGAREIENGGVRPDYIVDDLLATVPFIAHRLEETIK